MILIKYLRLTLVWTACVPALVLPRGKGDHVCECEVLLTGANINMERVGPKPHSRVLTEAMIVFEIVLYPRDLKKQIQNIGRSHRPAKE